MIIRSSILKFSVPSSLFILMSLSTSIHAVDASGNWSERGIGTRDGSCGEYIREEVSYQRWYEHWLMGYISGVNSGKQGKADFSKGVAAEGLIQWLQNYCTANPLSSFSDASGALLNELSAKK